MKFLNFEWVQQFQIPILTLLAGRIPVLCWRHPISGAALLRSSQPKVGLLLNRSTADESYISLCRTASGGTYISVMDARPVLNALVNRATQVFFTCNAHLLLRAPELKIVTHTKT